MASINEALKSLGNLIWGPKLFSFSSESEFISPFVLGSSTVKVDSLNSPNCRLRKKRQVIGKPGG